MLNMTVGVMPITVVAVEEQFYDSVWDDKVSRKVREVIRTTEGLPIGVQIVGLSFGDEKVLGLMKAIE